ncbi:ABC transporter substrate-binding protein/permease [Oenococcus sicerae]|uniref:ABC transporter substrate-binding protein/permease n=1 Tax=Oenococcus sicerae TaxID=2203724 RepID=UPI0026C332CE
MCRKISKSFICFLVLLLASSIFSLAASAKKPHYNITTDVTYPPFEFQKQNGSYTGIDVEIIRAIAKKENFSMTLKPISFNSGAQMVLSGQMDGIIAGMSITPERKQVYDFGTPYYKTGVVWAVAKKAKITKLSQLRGKTVALKTGTASADYAKSIQNKYGFKISYFNDSNTMYNDVAVGNSAAAFEDLPVMKYAIKNGLQLKIPNQKVANAGWYGFAVKKGKNQALLKAFDRGFAALKKDGSYDKIIKKYLGESQKSVSGSSASTAKSTSIWSLFKNNLPSFIDGVIETIKLTLVGILLASIWGILLGIFGVARSKIVRGFSNLMIYIFRGLPLLVLAFFIYIGMPHLLNMKIPAFIAGIVTLTLNEGAYTAAFVKGGFLSVDIGQMEAARSNGLSYWQSMHHIIMPQGIRIIVPSLINQFIITLKDTSILQAIGLVELTQTGNLIVARTQQGLQIWAIVAVIYLIMITLLTWLSNWVQNKLKVA